MCSHVARMLNDITGKAVRSKWLYYNIYSLKPIFILQVKQKYQMGYCNKYSSKSKGQLELHRNRELVSIYSQLFLHGTKRGRYVENNIVTLLVGHITFTI